MNSKAVKECDWEDTVHTSIEQDICNTYYSFKVIPFRYEKDVTFV